MQVFRRFLIAQSCRAVAAVIASREFTPKGVQIQWVPKLIEKMRIKEFNQQTWAVNYNKWELREQKESKLKLKLQI